MLERLEKFHIKEILFTLALIAIISRKYIMTFANRVVDTGPLGSLLFYGSMGILGLMFFMDFKKNITEIILVLISSIIYVFNGEGAILVLVLLAIAGKKICDKYIAKNYLIISTILLIITLIVFNAFPWLQTNSEVHYKYIKLLNTFIPRLDFGLGNPNFLYLFMVPIYVAYIFLRFKNYNNIDRIIMFGSVLFIYAITYSRTGCYSLLGGLIFVEIMKRIDIQNNKILSNLFKITPILLTIISVAIGTILTDNVLLNKLLSSRPKLWNVYLHQEGNFLALFGNKYSKTTIALNALDSSYVYILCTLGIIGCAFLMFLLYHGIDSFIKKSKKEYLVVVFIFLMYGFTENMLVNSAFSFGMVLLVKELILEDKFRFIFDKIRR